MCIPAMSMTDSRWCSLLLLPQTDIQKGEFYEGCKVTATRPGEEWAMTMPGGLWNRDAPKNNYVILPFATSMPSGVSDMVVVLIPR